MFQWLRDIKETVCPPSDQVLIERDLRTAEIKYFHSEAEKEYAEAQMAYMTTKIARLKARLDSMKEKKE